MEGYTDVISLHQAGIEHVVASGGTALTADQLRLIRKYTQNLTIVYDGDSAGVKAAMRGLDLALEEGLNVRLVLIPDNEDPDSYVKRIGATAFTEFIQQNRKDVILFQLEIALRDAGTDSNRKSAVVNQIAESIARINKAEDFTRQQDYIKRCAELLKIGEDGLTALVNKHIRERIQSGERKQQFSAPAEPETHPAEPGLEDVTDLLSPDEKQENAMVRALLEFGNRPWDDQLTVADHMFREIDENGLNELIDNKQLLQLTALYREMYVRGEDPNPKSFLYHPDPELNRIAVSLMDNSPFDISPHWKTTFERETPTREELYREEVTSCMSYLKLRKIKRLIAENQKDMERSSDPTEQIELIEVHRHLKFLEMELAARMGTVIFK